MLSKIGDNITKYYLQSRQNLLTLQSSLIDPLNDVLLSLDIHTTSAEFPQPLSFIEYPPSFYPENQQENLLETFKERIETLKNAKPLLNQVHSSLTNQAGQRLSIAEETEHKAEQQLELIEAEKERLDELNTELNSRQQQLKNYENEIILQEEKVEEDIQEAGQRLKQKVLEEVNSIKQEQLEYQQEFAMEKAQREQELLNLQNELNTTKKELSDLSIQKEELTFKQSLQENNQCDLLEIQEEANAEAEIEEEKLEFLQNSTVDDSILVENGTETLSGQCIELFKNASQNEEISLIANETVKSPVSQPSVMHDHKEVTAEHLKELAANIAIEKGFEIPTIQKPQMDPVPVAEWAQGEMLERCVLATYGVNPEQYFKSKAKTSVKELFGIDNHSYDMKNRLTDNWSKDKLAQKDIDCYQRSIGWLGQ